MNPLLPRKPLFFDLFQKTSVCITEMAQLLQTFSREFSHFEKFSEQAKDIEHRGDSLCHEVMDELNKSFITPFDREDIYQLAHDLDDIIDALEDVIHNFELYNIQTKKNALGEFSELIVETAVSLEALIAYLPKQKNGSTFNELVVRIHELEDKGDTIFQKAISELFSGEQDPMLVMKWKDILEDLEKVMDTFQEISDTIKGIIIKSS